MLDTVKPVIYNCKFFLVHAPFARPYISIIAPIKRSNNSHGILFGRPCIFRKTWKICLRWVFCSFRGASSFASQVNFKERDLNVLDSFLGDSVLAQGLAICYLMISDIKKEKQILYISSYHFPQEEFAVVYFSNSTVFFKKKKSVGK